MKPSRSRALLAVAVTLVPPLLRTTRDSVNVEDGFALPAGQRRGLLLSSFAGLLSSSASVTAARDKAELAPQGGTGSEECNSRCLKDWCAVDTRVCDCTVPLAQAGYTPPVTAPAALAAAGPKWPDVLNWEGAVMPRWNPVQAAQIEVKSSSLEGAGQGLYTTVQLSKGSILPPYRGPLLTSAEVKRRFNTSDMAYMWCPSGTTNRLVGIDSTSSPVKDDELVYCVDAASAVDGNPARFVNAAAQQAQCAAVNLEMCEIGKVLYFRTTRTMRPGEEFVTDYGENYWEDFAGCPAPSRGGGSRVVWKWLQSLRK